MPSEPRRHREPDDLADRFALGVTRLLRLLADTFFAKRYGHRAIVLETVAAVPGMVGAMATHLQCLRRLVDDDGWIQTKPITAMSTTDWPTSWPVSPPIQRRSHRTLTMPTPLAEQRGNAALHLARSVKSGGQTRPAAFAPHSQPPNVPHSAHRALPVIMLDWFTCFAARPCAAC